MGFCYKVCFCVWLVCSGHRHSVAGLPSEHQWQTSDHHGHIRGSVSRHQGKIVSIYSQESTPLWRLITNSAAGPHSEAWQEDGGLRQRPPSLRLLTERQEEGRGQDRQGNNSPWVFVCTMYADNATLFLKDCAWLTCWCLNVWGIFHFLCSNNPSQKVWLWIMNWLTD